MHQDMRIPKPEFRRFPILIRALSTNNAAYAEAEKLGLRQHKAGRMRRICGTHAHVGCPD